VANDSLYWAIELYAASDDYPLATRLLILDREHGYFQHAATAIIHAASGRVRLLADPAPEPVTASWIARFPSLFVRATALSPALIAALPPITDGAHTQALAFAVAGFRGDSLEMRRFAVPDAADSAASREPVHVLLPALGVSTLWTLLDGQDRVRGVVAAVGGVNRGTSWIPVTSDAQKWGGTLDRLRAADSAAHDATIVRSPVRVMPVGGRPLYLQTGFRWRPGTSPVLASVAVVANDTARIAANLASALGVLPKPASATAPSPVESRIRADSLYGAMRDALRRGDWTTFGRAFDALGTVLRAAPR
jgi:uncharacterized membrane protein (UPF0182 family)